MPRFKPFPALRYTLDLDLAEVTAPPYDVLSDADVVGLGERHPRNIVHVDVPRGGADRYEQAAGTFRAWVQDGTLVADGQPTFTIYRRRFTDATGRGRDLVGVLGALEVVDQGAGGVLAHERTTPKASTDRLDLTRAARAHLSPVWCLAPAGGLSQVLAAPGEPLGSVTVDRVEHVVERVTDPDRCAAITTSLADGDVLIADGHHRYAVSRQYRDEVRAATGRTDTPAELTLAFVGELVPEQLAIEAIHRLYDGVTAAELREALARDFEVTPAADPRGLDSLGPDTLALMERDGLLVLVHPDGYDWLAPRAGAFDGVRALDGALLEHTLQGSAAQASVTYQHGLDQVAAAVSDGRAGAAVLIRPVSIGEIERTATERLLMPPKSTYFTPKLRTGLVLRDLA